MNTFLCRNILSKKKNSLKFCKHNLAYDKGNEVKSFETLFENDSIHFKKDGTNLKKYPYIWLRDHCKCSKCFNQNTEELEFDLSEIPLNIKPTSVKNIANSVCQIICKFFYFHSFSFLEII